MWKAQQLAQGPVASAQGPGSGLEEQPHLHRAGIRNARRLGFTGFLGQHFSIKKIIPEKSVGYVCTQKATVSRSLLSDQVWVLSPAPGWPSGPPPPQGWLGLCGGLHHPGVPRSSLRPPLPGGQHQPLPVFPGPHPPPFQCCAPVSGSPEVPGTAAHFRGQAPARPLCPAVWSGQCGSTLNTLPCSATLSAKPPVTALLQRKPLCLPCPAEGEGQLRLPLGRGQGGLGFINPWGPRPLRQPRAQVRDCHQDKRDVIKFQSAG